MTPPETSSRQSVLSVPTAEYRLGPGKISNGAPGFFFSLENRCWQAYDIVQVLVAKYAGITPRACLFALWPRLKQSLGVASVFVSYNAPFTFASSGLLEGDPQYPESHDARDGSHVFPPSLHNTGELSPATSAISARWALN